MRAAYFSTGCRSMQLTVDGESVGVLGFPLALTVYRIPLLGCAFLASSFPRGSRISKPADFGSSTMASRWVGNASVGDSSGRMKGPEVQPPNRPNSCTYWIVADRLLAGEYPLSSFRSDKDCRKRLNQYLDAGITHFIDLTQPGEKESYDSLLFEEARRKGITGVTYQRLPIPDFDVPDASRMNEVLDSIDKAINSNRNVYVHCRGGIGRAGTAVGCYLVRHGNTGNEALEEVNRLFQFSDRRFDSFHSPETDEQVHFVLTWHDNDAPTKRTP
jgi:protein-tyrosine phosphatase